MDPVERALSSLRKGGFMVVYDSKGREAEADIFLGAEFATPSKIAAMRTYGGGLVCVAIGEAESEALGLPFMADVMVKDKSIAKQLILKRAKYGDKSAFSVSVNHNSTFTGITDTDRAKTMRELGKIVRKAENGGQSQKQAFSISFKAPGHVQLLRSSGLCNRKGHTEMAAELARMAGIAPAVALCEMLDGKTGKAATVAVAKSMAKKLRAPFLTGKQLMEALE